MGKATLEVGKSKSRLVLTLPQEKTGEISLDGRHPVDVLEDLSRLPGVMPANMSEVKVGLQRLDGADGEAAKESRRRAVRNLGRILGSQRTQAKRIGVNLAIVIQDDEGKVLYKADRVRGTEEDELKTSSIIDKVRDSLQRLWVPKREIDAQIRRQRGDVDSYSKAHELYRRGLRYGEIGEQLGVSVSTVFNWFDRKQGPYMLKSESMREKRMRKVEIPTTESTGFAYLLGAMSARMGRFNKVFDIAEKDEDVRAAIVDSAKSAGMTPRAYGRVLRFESKNFIGYVRELTDSGTRIPWEHLVTPEERKAFLKGFLDSKVSISIHKTGFPAVNVYMHEKPTIVRELILLSNQLGLTPKPIRSKEEMVGIQYPSREDLKGILDDIGLSSKKDQEILRQAMDSSFKGVLEKQTERFRQHRMEIARELTQGLTNPDAIGFLYRHGGLSSKAAREIALKANSRRWTELTDSAMFTSM